jgi:hypothetical protein
MSIWTDLLFLGGHIATPTGLTAVAPEAWPPRADEAASPVPQARVHRAAELAPAPLPAVAPNRVSPNDLLW